MQKFSDTIATTKPDGTIEVLPSATVTVYLAGTTTPATIYSTNTGTAKTNPFLSAASTGRIEFYAADGRYDLRVDKAGYATVSVLDVLLEDPDNIDDNLDGVTISNSTLSSCILLNATVNDVDSVSFSDTPDALTPRRMAWNADEGTLDVALDNNTTLQLGQELHYRARNATAATIADGAVVWATGTTGASGRISVGLAVADGSQPGKTVMGLMTHATAAGSDGYVAAFGKVRGVNTTGSAVGETWVNGDILYLHPTIPGALTKVKPTVNGHIVVTVAIVIYAGNNGTLFARPTADSQEADEIRYTPAGTGAVATTVQAKLRESVSVKDFGAAGGGVTDDTAAIQAALAAVNTAGGKGATVYFPTGVYTISSTIIVPDRIKLVGEGSRSTIVNSNFVGTMFSFPGRTNAGIIGMRLGIHSASGTKAIELTTPGNVDCRWLEFSELEISTPVLLDNQIGIRAVVSGSGIITECTFDNIKLYQVSSPIYIYGPEGNFFTNLTIAGFGASAPTSAIGPIGHANFIQGRVSGAPHAGSIAYSEGGARSIVDLVVDIGSNSSALNVTGTGNIIRLTRPELLTPAGTFSNSNIVIDSEFIAGKHIVSQGPTPAASAFSLGAGFGNAATITDITGNDQRIRFTVNAAGTGISAYPSIGYAFQNGAFPVASIPQITRDGGNQLTTSGFGSSGTVNGWGFLFGGTPVDGESYVFVVTV